MQADRQLLFGLLALHNGFVSFEQLVAAFRAWALDNSRGVEQILLEQQALEPAVATLLTALLEKQLERHGQDAVKCLAAVGSVDSSVSMALRSLADPALNASLGKAGRHRREWIPVALVIMAFCATAAFMLVWQSRAAVDKANRNLDTVQTNLVQVNGELSASKQRAEEQNKELTQSHHELAVARRKADAALLESRRRLSHLHFQHGVAEYTAGHLNNGCRNLFIAHAMADAADPLKPSYLQVLADRTTRGGRSPTLTMLHEGPVTSMAFSPDGSRIVTGSGDHAKEADSARLWDGRTGAPLGEPMRHDGVVYSVAFSPDETRVVTGSHDNTAQLWDSRTCMPLGEPMRHEGHVDSAVFSPDGTRVATRSFDKTARLWDGWTGTLLGQPMRHPYNWVNCVAFSPDGTRVITGAADGVARVWDGRTAMLRGEQMRHESSVTSVAFSPDGSCIVTGSKDKTARLWDSRMGTPLGEPMRHEKAVDSVAFSPDGTRVVTVSEDQSARLWDGRSGTPLGEPMRHENSVSCVAFSPDGIRIVTGSWDKTARLWDGRTGAPLGEPMRHENGVSGVAFNPDGTSLITRSWDNSARLWDLGAGTPLGEPMRHESNVASAVFSPDGTRVVTRSYQAARLWDGQTGKPLGVPMRHEGIVNSVAISSDGTRVVTGSADKTARLWDGRTGKPLGELMRQLDTVNSVAFSPDGTRVVTGCAYGSSAFTAGDGSARMWDGRTGIRMGERKWYEQRVTSVAFSPNGTRVVTGLEDNTARLWDGRTGAPLGEWMRHEGRVGCVVFSPDGTRVVSGSDDKTARLWDGRTGAPLGDWMRHEGKVESVAFSPDGTHVVTGSYGIARLWDGRTGALLSEPLRVKYRLTGVAFSPDGTRVVTGSQDGTLRMWDGRTGTPLGEPLLDGMGVNSVAFSPDGSRIVTGSGDAARLWDASIINAQPRTEFLELEIGISVNEDGKVHHLTETELTARRQTLIQDQAWLRELRALVDKRTTTARRELLRTAGEQNNPFAVKFDLRRLTDEERALPENLAHAGMAAAELEQWDEAAETLQRAVDAGAAPVEVGTRLCLVLVACQRRDQAARVAAALLLQHAKSPNATDRYSLAYRLLQVPGLADPTQLLPLAESSYPERYPDGADHVNHLELLAAAQYRADQAAEAVSTLKELYEMRDGGRWQQGKVKPPTIRESSFLALSYQKLGKPDDATKWRAEADQAITAALGRNPLASDYPDWEKRLQYRWLQQELQAAGIQPAATPPAKSDDGPPKPQ